MDKFSKILSNYKNSNPLVFLYQNGHSPEKVKSEIISQLSPFFTNKDILAAQVPNFLVTEYITLIKLKATHPDLAIIIPKVIAHYNSAKSKDERLLHSTINALLPDYNDTGNRFWTFVNFEVNKLNLELADFVQTAMTNISDTVEGLTKILLHENLFVDNINRNKQADIHKIKSTDLGVILDDLSTHSPFKELFKIPPENLKLSDWRNIASHHNHKLIPDDKILCEYGPKHNRKFITITRDDLLDRLTQCINRMLVLQLAHKFYFADNAKEIIKINPDNLKVKEREEIGFLQFTSSIYGFGFEILDIDYKKDGDASMTIQDLTNDDPYKRAIYSAQLVFPLWLIANSNNSKIEYRTKNGRPFLKAETTRDICVKIRSGQRTTDYLIENTKIEFIKNVG